MTRLRGRASGVIRGAMRQMGRFEPMSHGETALVRRDPVSFQGDIPIRAGEENTQYRIEFETPRPLFEDVENLIVTPDGAGWSDGVLYERYSAAPPSPRMMVRRPSPERVVETGITVQSTHADTFGDWMSEYLAPLAGLDRIDAPVFLPAFMARKSYAKRDMARTGVAYETIDAPVLIRRAKVVRQPKYMRYWSAGHVIALRRFLKASPPLPRPGSLIYLSREKEESEIAIRSHPHNEIANVIEAHGGKIIRTANAALETFVDAGAEAETVVMDHGSAGYNMLYWRPRRVIELVSDDWWINAFLFFSHAIGVRDYTIIRSDIDGVSEKLNAALARSEMDEEILRAAQ